MKFKTLEELREERNRMIGFDPENEQECLEAVKDNGFALKYVANQTPELCLIAVKENGFALSHVKNRLLKFV